MTKNEFTAKKLGEVAAFSRIGCELAERGGEAFERALGEKAASFTTELAAFEASALQFGTEVTVTKAEKTTEKLRSMMEKYIGDEWDDPVELLEWLSFFTGSASAHWALVGAAAEAEGLIELHRAATAAAEQYHQYLHQTIEGLAKVGKEKGAI